MPRIRPEEGLSPTGCQTADSNLFGGCGHGINLLQPERCARAAFNFWREVAATSA